MTLLPALFLVLTSHSADLTDSTYDIPAHDARHVDAEIANWPAAVEADFDVAGKGQVTMQLVPQSELRNFVLHRDYGALAEVENQARGTFAQSLPGKGDYSILLINSTDHPETVHLHATIEFAAVTLVPPERRKAILLTSFGVFFASVGLSGAAVVRAMRRGAKKI